MLDTARSFAIRWLLEPAKAAKPEPTGIRFVIGLVDRNDFAEFSHFDNLLIKRTVEDGVIKDSIWDTLERLIAVKIYNGSQYLGAYVSMGTENKNITVDGETTTEYYDAPQFDNTYEIYEYTEAADTILDDVTNVGWTKNVIVSAESYGSSLVNKTRIQTVHTPNIYVNMLWSLRREIDSAWWDMLGKINEVTDNPQRHLAKISFNGRYDYIYTEGLTNELRKKYIEMFNQNSNVIEFEF